MTKSSTAYLFYINLIDEEFYYFINSNSDIRIQFYVLIHLIKILFCEKLKTKSNFDSTVQVDNQ